MTPSKVKVFVFVQTILFYCLMTTAYSENYSQTNIM